MAASYSKIFMPLRNVKDKEFLSRLMGCKAVGFSYLRIKPGQGATYVHRHKVQEEVFITVKCDGTIILDGNGSKWWKGQFSELRPTFGAPSATTRRRMWCL
jgi:uncharacterized cupin superfamily protein